MAGGEEDEHMESVDKAGEESSDDDIEIVPKSVDNYWLEHGDETPVSFASLPYFKNGEETAPDKVVYVRGTQDNGMRLYMRAVAWKLELTKDIKPAFHLKTEKYWIQLLKPRKSYEETIRSIISVAQFLNYAQINVEDPEKAVWSHVKDVFSSWEVPPSRNDLSSHLQVVRHIAASDAQLATSYALQTLDIGVSKKRLASTTEDGRQSSRKGMYVSDDEDDVRGEPTVQPDPKRSKFELDELNSGEEMDGYGEETDSDEVGDLSETVCCICDNGGTVICCDGKCMRSFHLNKGAGGAEDSHCSTLGFSKAEAERMEKFFCPNCEFKIHQCYACGVLGCSDEAAGAAQEVFMCDSAMCGHFYHPKCVVELIAKDKDSNEQDAIIESIKEGKGFVCPMHKCLKCGKGEVKEEKDLQFGICRRCPRVWHRKCLPFSLPSDDSENEEPQRAWDDLLPNRLLVYCKRHPIITRLGTPLRTHVKFPEGSLPSAKRVLVKSRPEQQEKKSKLIKIGSKKESAGLKIAAGLKASKSSEFDVAKKKKHFSSLGLVRVPTKSKLDSDGVVSRVPTPKASERHSGPFLIKGRSDLSKGRLEEEKKLERSSSTLSKPPTPRESALLQLQQKSKPPVAKAIIIDSATKNMINDIIERTKALVTIESVLKKQDIPNCYRRNSKNHDKKYSLFKIESITKGMRKALETLENGGTIEDAKAKCSPDFIRFIEVCRNDLRVYLSPFLHGARYTSYGRHFTKSEKLEEIVDRLHWYVEKGDMIVDFCCGANEFSLFMRKKLEETGKKCDYKNFDLIQTKNDFNFTKQDWFQVEKDQLPDGDRLIMGLNPPFGVKGQLANQFIDHALKFRPKLIVLIVPKETERLDRKRDMYDLVWEDSDLLSGQSFYLPGSVDVDENPLNDWNVVAPPLYLWSRPDWTPTHRKIASSNGHISPDSSTCFVGGPWRPPPRPSSPILLLDTGVDQNDGLMAPMELGAREEKKNYTTLAQPKIVDEEIGVQESGTKFDRAKLKEQNKKIREPLKSMTGDDSASILDTKVEEKSLNSSKVKSASKSGNKDGSAQKKLPEGRHLESSGKVLDVSQAIQSSMKNDKKGEDKKGELLKRKISEGQGHFHAQRIDKAKFNSQDSPEKTRHSSETRHDTFRKDRKSNDRYDRGDDVRTDPSHDGRQWKRGSDRHRLSAEADFGGRRSPGRHDKYDSGRRKSPDKYDRHGMNRHGEDRNASPERSRHTSDQRKGSPDKSRYSSVVDLATLYSGNDGKKDRSRDYDDFSRKSTGKDYQDYRGASPDRRYVPEEGKRSWVSIDSYQGASDNQLQSNDHLNMDYKNSGLPKSSYDDMGPYGLKHSEEPVNPLGKHYYEHEALGVRRQDAYDVQMAGGYNDPVFSRQSRHADFYQPERPREMLGLQDINYPVDRYGVPLRTEATFRATAGGVGALPERSLQQPPWQGTVPPPRLYPPVYGSQLQQQAPLGLGNPALLSAHGLYDNRLPQTQSNRPQYPSNQGRFPGQANQQFSGGWFDD